MSSRFIRSVKLNYTDDDDDVEERDKSIFNVVFSLLTQQLCAPFEWHQNVHLDLDFNSFSPISTFSFLFLSTFSFFYSFWSLIHANLIKTQRILLHSSNLIICQLRFIKMTFQLKRRTVIRYRICKEVEISPTGNMNLIFLSYC